MPSAPVLDANLHDITYTEGQVANNATITNPGTADPTGTTNAGAFGANETNDGQGAFQITTAGTAATGALRTITLHQPYETQRPVVATVCTVLGVPAGGTITATMSAPGTITISVGTALTTATTYNVYYRVL
jgi:hypothetical protein